ncbi:hypothetical protein [Mucilaginibacter polytrichastri]|uniref:Peptidase S74 domain-containing protein n=1 Tax=Mucilaginibacter polytrichastri TaxID=1302689 RepID=A0A1Q5ZV74_9SPHI|nr:hypothetical protein [Mucilaginibacter polytrichastri]OKS85674.1 hypothetical protein RG47T_1120 [Mucilaginibacter polytrichastri]SFS62101.1 hypothetical protein SAMN04487890_102459 [Mucilaginibacter polytrichastri]
MKRILLAILPLIAASYSYAQNTPWSTSGNIGIGTTTPQAALDIGGLIQISVQNKAVPPSDISYGLFPYGGVGLGIFSGAHESNQGIGIWTNPNGNKTEVVRILSGGNVGIGTITPDAKLSVAGTIHAQAVKVDMIGWSDFVFKPTYKLYSLALVKSYIDRNHHLPDMPSEDDIIKDGLDIGAMSKIQTKKIEELTLYLIEKDRQVQLQQAQIDNQQQQINDLKLQMKTLLRFSHK